VPRCQESDTDEDETAQPDGQEIHHQIELAIHLCDRGLDVIELGLDPCSKVCRVK